MAATPENKQPDELAAFVDKALERSKEIAGKGVSGAREVALRVLVHFAALLSTGAILSVAPPPPDHFYSAGLGLYIGLICLAARGMRLAPEWLGPACLGLIQTGILLVAGLPVYQAVFWGGAQAWVQRLFVNRLNMGTEWVVLFFLLPLGIQLGGAAPKLKLLIGSFAGLAFGGQALLRKIARRLAKLRGEPVQEEIRIDHLAPFRASIAKLRDKQPQLPANIRPTVSAIAVSAESILACMAEDARDQEPGTRFLKRYLPAAHSVVDKHRRLAREDVVTMDMADALAKSEDMLHRLEAAFAREHGYLLRNDVDDFSADLKVLDTLLKMDGR